MPLTTSEIRFTTAEIFSFTAELLSERRPTSSATTPKPLPCSPALAASIFAFKARIFCLLWILFKSLVHFRISFTRDCVSLIPADNFSTNSWKCCSLHSAVRNREREAQRKCSAASPLSESPSNPFFKNTVATFSPSYNRSSWIEEEPNS